MQDSAIKRIIPWVLAIYIAFVFIQSLFFKFSGSTETVIIFNTIADWMGSIGVLAWLAEPFRNHGGNAVGITELIAAILVLIPRTRLWGAIIALAVMSGAIFFHLGTPLGVDRTINEMGDTDGGVLFFMACGVWIAAAITIFLNRGQLSRS